VNDNTCPYCENEFPSPRFVKRHEKHCLVRLRRLNQHPTDHHWTVFLERMRAKADAIQAKQQVQS